MTGMSLARGPDPSASPSLDSQVPSLSLDAIAGDPTVASALSPVDRGALIVRAAAALAALGVGMAQEPDTRDIPGPPASSGDRLLNVQAAAFKLGCSRDYLYRHAKTLPFTVRVGRRVRFSVRGIDTYIRRHQGR